MENKSEALIHLRKLCVGIETPDELRHWQQINLPIRQGKIWHVTRSWPKRAEDLLKGGSIFWIIKGEMRLRQQIIGFEEHPLEPGDKKPKCRILLDSELVETQPWPHRPFQGWRYLPVNEAPPDLREGGHTEGEMPAAMAAELRELGLL